MRKKSGLAAFPSSTSLAQTPGLLRSFKRVVASWASPGLSPLPQAGSHFQPLSGGNPGEALAALSED